MIITSAVQFTVCSTSAGDIGPSDERADLPGVTQGRRPSPLQNDGANKHGQLASGRSALVAPLHDGCGWALERHASGTGLVGGIRWVI